MLIQALEQQLAARHQAHLYRERPVLQSPQAAEVSYNGQRYLNFCSNNYLGLANHPAVIKALQQGAQRYGVSSTAAQVLGGYSHAHQALEEELADFIGYPRVLLFTNGYLANLSIITTFYQKADAIFLDRLSHASLLDGARYSGAAIKRYRHRDSAHLQHLLNTTTGRYRLIATDGVFSADGTLAPVTELAALAKAYQACLLTHVTQMIACEAL